MVNHQDAQLDRIFAALADTTRRGVLAQLGAGSSSITELAQPHGMSLPGFMKHLAVLESAGLIARSKAGRVVRCELDAAPMESAALWIARYQRFWNTQLDALERYLEKEEDTPCKQPLTPNPRSSSSAARIAPRRRKSGARGRRKTR